MTFFWLLSLLFLLDLGELLFFGTTQTSHPKTIVFIRRVGDEYVL